MIIYGAEKRLYPEMSHPNHLSQFLNHNLELQNYDYLAAILAISWEARENVQQDKEYINQSKNNQISNTFFNKSICLINSLYHLCDTNRKYAE